MERTKNGNRLRLWGLASVALTTFLAGCGDQGASSATKAPTATEATKEPLKLSMMNMYYSAEPPKADNEAIKLIEAHTNTKLDITWVPNSAYNDKINATIAGGELPKIMMIASNKSSGIVNVLGDWALFKRLSES
jgi:putative aldouronate transport system substrate-binding protein